MQEYTEISDSTTIKDSRGLFLANDKTIASHFAGTAFPTENLIIGMECYRTDQKIKYRLTNLSPVTWEATLTADAVVKIKVDNAVHADTASMCSGNAATAARATTAGTADTAKVCTGNAATASKLQTARKINGVAFDGSGDITVSAAANGGTSAACSGNAASATKLQTARTINGVSFNGTGNITITATANGGNADTTDGKHANDAAGQIALKDSDNDLNCRLLRSTYANQNTISGAIAFRTNNSADNYTRYCSDAAAIRNFIGLGSVNNTADVNKTVKAATTATNVSGGTVSATNITSMNGRLESAGTSSNLPQVLLHIPNVNYSRLRMSTDGVIHAQNGGNDNYVNMKAANFIGNLSGKATTAGTADNANKLIGKNWNWSGQGGQPTWLWGGSDGTNMYVYNPVNFRVANANTVADKQVGNAANKIPVYSADGHLVLPSGAEIW